MNRIFTPEDIKAGINTVASIRQKAFGFVPMATDIETLDGHCIGCKAKKTFQVEGTEKMKNGAQRKYGKCPEGNCGRTISTFVAGVKDATALQ